MFEIADPVPLDDEPPPTPGGDDLKSEIELAMPSPPDTDAPTAVDLFAGCGGFAEGVDRAGFETAGFVEMNLDMARTFAANHGAPLIGRNIRRIHDEVVERFADEAGGVDLVVGGPPCKGMSMIGDRDPEDDRNALFREFLRFVELLEPEAFIMENVPAITSMQTPEGDWVVEVCADMADAIGYEVRSSVLCAADYGVPQTRRRFFMVGVREGTPPDMPRPTHCEPPVLPGMGLEPWRTVEDAIGDLPEVGPREWRPHGDRLHWGALHTDETIAKMDGVPPGGQSPECGGDKSFGAYTRKRWDEPSATIHGRCRRARAPDTWHPEQNRTLTPREGARLQAFPDTYEWRSSNWQNIELMIGNAVPPPMAEVVGRAVAQSIADEEGL